MSFVKEERINAQKNPKENYLKQFTLICLLIFIISVGYFFAVNYVASDPENRGTFGDMFGGLNAIFSGFAFAGVIITIIMQMKELELTRNELKKSAEAQDKSQQALNEQLNSMKLTSTIEILDKYIESSFKDEHKVDAAMRIIAYKTDEILHLEEHKSILFPKLEVNILKKGIDPLSGELQKLIVITNSGGTLRKLEIPTIDNMDYLDGRPGKYMKNKEVIILKIKDIQTEHILSIKYQGVIFNNLWKQILRIRPVKNGIYAEISVPKLIS